MKKISFLVLSILLVASLPCFALDYTITFTGTGASTTVESVIVQNLTQGTTITVPGGNVLTLNVSPNAVDQLSANNEGIRIYPNPMQGKSTVSFYAKQAGNTLINVFGIDGRQMVGINKNLQEGDNSFLISLPKGVYAVQVAGNEYSYIAKVISQTNLQNKPEITFTGNEKPVSSAPHKIKSAVTSMLYTDGDRLLYKGISGNYSTIVTDIPTQSKSVTFSFVDCTDADGNHYPVVQIGTQIWMAENLKSTKYRTSEAIPNVTDNTQWGNLRSGAYCDYDNRIEYSAIYGKLYNWHAVHDSRNIAPVGWHIPNNDEWTRLTNYLGGSDNAGQMLKDITNWTVYTDYTGSIVATNETGFTALPGGARNYSNGMFGNIQDMGDWWSSVEYSIPQAYAVEMGYTEKRLVSGNIYKELGFSVRCLSDVNLAAGLPIINTSSVTSTTTITSTSGGIIKSDGGANVTARGVCWSTSQSPTILDAKTTDGSGVGSFTSNLTGLSPNTIYYVRAYATNSVGTGYGDENSYKTFTGTVTDIDGNTYNTITIGKQVWTVENLKTTKYNDGTSIPNVTVNTAWTALSTPAYCWSNNDDFTYKNKYGALYNWYVVNTAKLAPTGWHVPTDAEWTTLENYVSANLGTSGYVAKALAANTNWTTDTSTGAIGNDLTKNNSSGFSALPGGYRSYGSGTFYAVGTNGNWWSSTKAQGYITDVAWGRDMHYNSSFYRQVNVEAYGYSVRCVMDTLTVYTTSVSNITTNSAICGGNIITIGNAPVTERGICYSTSQNPTTSNSKIVIGSGTGTFSSTVSGLTASTTYYLRAYAINSSGTQYGTQISFTTQVIDIDGNVYHTITIGTQTWMVENLKTTKYNDGTAIPLVTGNTAWAALSTPAYCWYNNDATTYKNTYGALYNWYAVNTAKLAPTGWHVPTDAEWTTLENYVSANLGTSGSVAKALAASTNWTTDTSVGAIGNDLSKNNSSGFSALPGSFRFSGNGSFGDVGGLGEWWSATEGGTGNAWFRSVSYYDSYVYRYFNDEPNGFSVRCVKDITVNYDGFYNCAGYRIRPGNPTEPVPDGTIEQFNTVDATTCIKNGFGNYTSFSIKIEVTTNTMVVGGVTCFKVNATTVDLNGNVVDGGMFTTWTGDAASAPAPPTNPTEINYYNPVTKTFVLNCYYNNSAGNRIMYEVLMRISI